MPFISRSWTTLRGDAAFAGSSLLAMGYLLMGTGVSLGRMSDLWLNGFFLADSECYMLDSIFTGMVGDRGTFGM